MRLKLLLLLCLLVPSIVLAQSELAVPALQDPVADQIGLLSQPQIQALNSRLRNFEATTGSQIAILIINSTAPEPIEAYAIRVFDQWKLGRAQYNDGVLILLALKDRALRIEVGRGLEGAIPDAISKQIGSDLMVPYIKQKQYFEGINAGLNTIESLIKGEGLPASAQKAFNKGSRGSSNAFVALLVAFFAIAQFVVSILGVFGALLVAVAVAAFSIFSGFSLISALFIGFAAFVLVIILSSANAVSNSSGYYGSRGYRSTRGFGSGGSFGGFSGGGGSSAGGGSTSRW